MRCYVTFRQRWRLEAHPLGGHPDGVFAVDGEDWLDVVEQVEGFLGSEYSAIYQEGDLKMELFPRGIIAKIGEEVQDGV